MNATENTSPTPEHPGATEPADACSAANALQRAKDELKKAQELYERVRDRAAQQVQTVRSKTVGDLLDGTLDVVRKHPGKGLLAAVLAGVFLGRLFRR